jgi:tartrate dehydratase beta subunit/fumarate hydratase class I family protein
MTVIKKHGVYFAIIGAAAFVNANRIEAMKMASKYAFGVL